MDGFAARAGVPATCQPLRQAGHDRREAISDLEHKINRCNYVSWKADSA
jgi:hypothetical protein